MPPTIPTTIDVIKTMIIHIVLCFFVILILCLYLQTLQSHLISFKKYLNLLRHLVIASCTNKFIIGTPTRTRT